MYRPPNAKLFTGRDMSSSTRVKQLTVAIPLSVLLLFSAAYAVDLSQTSLIAGHARLTLHSNDKFGYTIGHELEEEHKERMKNLEESVGFGASISYRRGFSPSILLGVSADYIRSGTMKHKDEFGEIAELVQNPDSADSEPLGSYSLLGLSLSLYPGVSITDDLMVFGELGLGGYTADLAGKTEELNAALNLGLHVSYFMSNAICLELSTRLPVFLADFVWVEENYSLDPSPLQLTFGCAWVRQ